ncbi:hypothetical protein V6N13_039137 [Hibiscus sabdariffa]
MLQALIQFWNPGYCCFTLNGKDLMPTVEEYTELLRIPNVLEGRIYTKPEKSCNRFEMLGQLVGRSVQWADGRFSKKGGSLCFPWYSIAEIARTYPDPHKKARILAVAIYSLPYSRNLSRNLPFSQCMPPVGGRTFQRMCSFTLRLDQEPLLENPKQVLSGINFMNFSPLKEFLEKEWDEVDSTKWVEAFRNLQEQDLVWRVLWLRCRKFLYKCYDHDWLMLLGLWGGIGCAPLLVSRQFGSQQFVPYTAGLRDSEFHFDTDFRKRVVKINKNWKFCYWIKVAGGKEGLVTPEYESWAQMRINDTLPLPNQGQDTSMEDHLRVFQSEADLLRVELADAKVEIEKMNAKYTRDLFLAKVQVDKFTGEAEQATKKYSKMKIEYDIQNSDFKKLEAAVKHMELRKTPAQWRQEIQQAEDRQKELAKQEIERNQDLVRFEKEKGKETVEQYHQALKVEKDNTAAWKRKAHDSKIRLIESQRAYDALEVQLNQSRAQYSQLEARVREQEEMIREFQARDEYAELQASQSKIEKLEKEVKDLWALVQTCQISIQVLEDIKQGGNDYWFTRLRDAVHQFQEQDKINEKIMNLAQDVEEHVTMLAREARVLRPHVVSNEMKASLELLFDQIKDLGIRFDSWSIKILHPYFTRSKARTMNMEDRMATMETNHQVLQDRLEKLEKDLKDEIA